MHLKDRTGFSYRNMLPVAETSRLLETIRPHGAYSGDDHDQCKVKHFIADTLEWLYEVCTRGVFDVYVLLVPSAGCFLRDCNASCMC